MYLRDSRRRPTQSAACPTPCPLTGGYTNVADGPCRRRGVVETGQKWPGPGCLLSSRRVRHLALDPADDHVDHVGAFLRGQFPALGDLVPAQQAGAATGGGGVLGDEDRVAAVGGLPAVLVRLGRGEALADELAGRPRGVAAGPFSWAVARSRPRRRNFARNGCRAMASSLWSSESGFRSGIAGSGGNTGALRSYDRAALRAR